MIDKNKLAQQASRLRDLQQMDGWAILLQMKKDRISELVNSLLTSRTLEEVCEIQGRVGELNAFFSAIDNLLTQAEQQQEQD